MVSKCVAAAGNSVRGVVTRTVFALGEGGHECNARYLNRVVVGTKRFYVGVVGVVT